MRSPLKTISPQKNGRCKLFFTVWLSEIPDTGFPVPIPLAEFRYRYAMLKSEQRYSADAKFRWLGVSKYGQTSKLSFARDYQVLTKITPTLGASKTRPS